MPTDRTDKKWEVVVLGVVAVIALLIALVIGLTITDGEPGTASSTPLISMLVALVPLTITSLLALLRTNDARKEAEHAKAVVEETKAVAEKTQQDLTNGVLTANMRAAIRAVAAEDDIALNDAGDDTPPGGVPRIRRGPEPGTRSAHRAIRREDGELPGAPGQPGADYS